MLAAAAGRSCRLQITVAVLLMTHAWSVGHGNSAAACGRSLWPFPCRVWLMACGARGRGQPTPGGRLPTGPSCGALAVFCTPADWWDPPSLGRTDRPSWA